jgi:hypothetical protein
MKSLGSKIPKWLRYLLIALPLGVLVGAPLPFVYFLSERRDWGKTYDNYSDFVFTYVSWAVQYSLIVAAIIWLVLMLSSWAFHRRKLKKASAHQASVAPDHE